jgi:hypothetical protein
MTAATINHFLASAEICCYYSEDVLEALSHSIRQRRRRKPVFNGSELSRQVRGSEGEREPKIQEREGNPASNKPAPQGRGTRHWLKSTKNRLNGRVTESSSREGDEEPGETS